MSKRLVHFGRQIKPHNAAMIVCKPGYFDVEDVSEDWARVTCKRCLAKRPDTQMTKPSENVNKDQR